MSDLGVVAERRGTEDRYEGTYVVQKPDCRSCCFSEHRKRCTVRDIQQRTGWYYR